MRDVVAPLTAAGIVFGGGVFLYLTIGAQGVEDTRLIISGLMGAAATFLFGDAAQRRVVDAQPTVVSTAGPPPTTTVTGGDAP